MRRKFPDDHPCEYLRGHKIPNPSRALRTFAMRAAWITKKLDQIASDGGDLDTGAAQFFREELAAISVAVQHIEEQRKRRREQETME